MALCMILLCKHEWYWHLQHHFLAVQHQLCCYCRVYGEDSQVYNNGRYTHVHRWKFDRTSHLCYRFVYSQLMTVCNQDYRYGWPWPYFQCRACLLASILQLHFQRSMNVAMITAKQYNEVYCRVSSCKQCQGGILVHFSGQTPHGNPMSENNWWQPPMTLPFELLFILTSFTRKN